LPPPSRVPLSNAWPTAAIASKPKETNALRPLECPPRLGTKFGYSNGVYFEKVFTQEWLPIVQGDAQAFERSLQETRERNARLGIDQDIASREADLKEKARLLAVGMASEQVIDVMGKPDNISGIFFEGTNWVGKIVHLDDLPKYTGKTKHFGFTYTPYGLTNYLRLIKKPIRLQPYENLNVSFDENGQVRWFYWSQ
jgi:hypothetical protein